MCFFRCLVSVYLCLLPLFFLVFVLIVTFFSSSFFFFFFFFHFLASYIGICIFCIRCRSAGVNMRGMSLFWWGWGWGLLSLKMLFFLMSCVSVFCLRRASARDIHLHPTPGALEGCDDKLRTARFLTFTAQLVPHRDLPVATHQVQAETVIQARTVMLPNLQKVWQKISRTSSSRALWSTLSGDPLHNAHCGMLCLGVQGMGRNC